MPTLEDYERESDYIDHVLMTEPKLGEEENEQK